jgi:REP-associated tyrosine transposase
VNENPSGVENDELVGGETMSYWRLFYHIIWSTRQREPLIDERTRATIERSFRAILEEKEAIPHAIGMMPDHVHLAVSVPPRFSISEFMHHVKGASSRLVNASRLPTEQGRFGWQPDYGVLTFEEELLPDIVTYVENQAQNHVSNNLWLVYEDDGSWPRTPQKN